jgi:protein-S-isoprenylcysteine O-methyltransferase Ste14
VRAILEERFLSSLEPTYADYMRRVRYRFIPGVA